jgi:DNA replication protein DnaC
MEVVPGKGAHRCPCRAQDHRHRLFEAARIPSRYRECSLSNFTPAKNNGSQLRAFAFAHRLVSEYLVEEHGLLFAGPCGVGKTHLAVAVLHGLIEKGVQCLFYECGALLKEIQETYNPASHASGSELLSAVCGAEVLLLDELGAVKPTDWARDTMTQIIGRRYNDKKIIILTTNYPDESPGKASETLEDRIGARMRSRLYEMCRTVRVEGDDYRRRFDAQQV